MPTLMSGLDSDNFFKCLDHLENSNYLPATVKEYSINNVSDKIARVILSYKNYVKRYFYYQNDFK